ncbi:MAG: phospholipid methyltransferase [Planctomycetes bacterium]|nr:phospholipid methyltransferase [Planctomycetota bacterium]
MTTKVGRAFGFFLRFLRHPGQVGALWPSSRHLAQAMVAGIELAPGDVVVEFGPGLGPFTALLRETMPRGVRYLGIELDPKFYRHLTERFPDLAFHHGSADEADVVLERMGLPKAKLILSGLPFASFPHDLQARILDATQRALRPDGLFRTFTYVGIGAATAAGKRFRRMMRERFARAWQSKPVLRNVPPAYVLSYQP